MNSPGSTHKHGSTSNSAGAPFADPDCTICHGAGHYLYDVPYTSPLFGQLQRCQCLAAAQVAARQEALASRVAALTAQLQAELGRFQYCTLDGFDPHRPLPHNVEWGGRVYAPAEQRKSLLWAFSVARQYEPVESLYLHGSYGSGKSHLAAGILNALAAKGIAGRYGSAPALLRLVRQGFRDGSADDRLEALMTVPLLVIDDLGTEHESGWSETSLFDLINVRYLNERATIFTSNDPVEAHRDPRIISRINGTAQIVTFVAYDHRLLGHAAEVA